MSTFLLPLSIFLFELYVLNKTNTVKCYRCGSKILKYNAIKYYTVKYYKIATLLPDFPI